MVHSQRKQLDLLIALINVFLQNEDKTVKKHKKKKDKEKSKDADGEKKKKKKKKKKEENEGRGGFEDYEDRDNLEAFLGSPLGKNGGGDYETL